MLLSLFAFAFRLAVNPEVFFPNLFLL
jgi:hypothetical protein